MAPRSYFVIVAYLLYVGLLARVRPLPPKPRAMVALFVIADTFLLWWVAGLSSGMGLIVRDWMPAAQILFTYWLSGLFAGTPMPRAEAWLRRWDRWLFDDLGLSGAVVRAPRLALEALEGAYLSVYLVVPLGFGIVWFAAPNLDVHRYWTVVVAAEVICYAMLPWIRTRPPRALGDHTAIDRRDLVLRRINLRVLERGSVQANTVPSGHAAGSLATALMVMEYLPAAGAALLVLAAAIMAGSIVGRYHYAMDSLTGAAVALCVWVVL